MKTDSFPINCLDISHPCWTGNENDFDHEWKYEPGDPDCGVNPYHQCMVCEKTQDDMDPPDYDDY